jgi:hypothetical protein
MNGVTHIYSIDSDPRIIRAGISCQVHDNLYIVPQSLNFIIVVHKTRVYKHN